MADKMPPLDRTDMSYHRILVLTLEAVDASAICRPLTGVWVSAQGAKAPDLTIYVVNFPILRVILRSFKTRNFKHILALISNVC